MPASVDTAHAGIVNAVRGGALPAARLDEAARRVATLQLWRGRSRPPQAKASAKIALYGRSHEAFDALLAVLAGAAAAPGKLPVAVGAQAPGSGCR
jgi:beta-N-acetylhexosaminidase